MPELVEAALVEPELLAALVGGLAGGTSRVQPKSKPHNPIKAKARNPGEGEELDTAPDRSPQVIGVTREVSSFINADPFR